MTLHMKGCGLGLGLRFVVLGTFTRTEPGGKDTLAFSGRLRRGALKPGRYTLALTPSDAARNRGRGQAISFTIVRG